MPNSEWDQHADVVTQVNKYSNENELIFAAEFRGRLPATRLKLAAHPTQANDHATAEDNQKDERRHRTKETVAGDLVREEVPAEISRQRAFVVIACQ